MNSCGGELKNTQELASNLTRNTTTELTRRKTEKKDTTNTTTSKPRARKQDIRPGKLCACACARKANNRNCSGTRSKAVCNDIQKMTAKAKQERNKREKVGLGKSVPVPVGTADNNRKKCNSDAHLFETNQHQRKPTVPKRQICL